MRRPSCTWNASPARMYSRIRSTPARYRSRVVFETPSAGFASVRRSSGGKRRRHAQLRDRPLDFGHRAIVLGAQRRVAQVVVQLRTHDDARLRPQVVDDDQRVGEHEQRVGHRHRLLRRRRKPLDQPHHVVREEADGAAPERAELPHLDRRARADRACRDRRADPPAVARRASRAAGVQSSTSPSRSRHAARGALPRKV